MTEQIASAWGALIHFLTSKITSAVVAGAVVVSAETAKTNSYINIVDSGFLWFSYADWMKVVGCVWLLILIIEKLGAFKLARWVYSKLGGK